MALGNITQKTHAESGGNLFIDRVSVLGVNPYVAGGLTGLAAKMNTLRKSTVTIVSAEGVDELGLYYASYDHDNDKLFVRVAATGVEAGAIDLSAVVFNLTVISK